MEAKQPMSSVIASLMGFDEVSTPPQSVSRPNRVLSEDYLHKSDSICLLERQSYRKRRLSKVNSKTGQRNYSSIEVQGREKLHRNSSGSVQRADTNSRVEMADAYHSPSNIGTLRSILGKSESEMKLNFLSARKTTNQLLEKWKMTKGAKQFVVNRQSNTTIDHRVTLEELENKSDKGNHGEEISENSNLSTCAHSCIGAEYEQATTETKAAQDMLRKGREKNYGFETYATTQDTLRMSHEKNHGFETYAKNLEMFSENSEGEHFEPTSCTLDVDDELCPHTCNGFLIEQELSVSSSCPKIDPEFHTSQGEYYSPSPNSVLDLLFNEENLSISDSIEDNGDDRNGLQKQLQLLESRLEETPLEEHGMVVSSDEDKGDESVDSCNNNRKFLRLFRPQESRDSSYINDVLDEANFFSEDTKLESKAWHYLECPLNPSFFEILEKKYDKQLSWNKSERRLLFDRINLGIKDILYPYVDVFADTKPLRKSFKLSQSREEIEDELWRFLFSHENGANKTLSEKALGTETKWFDLRDDIDFIVSEIERFLFEKLSAELLYD